MKPAPSVLPPPAPLRWRIHRLARGLGEHGAAWQALQRTLALQHPMLDASYIDALLTHFGSGHERLCVLHDGQAPHAMTILQPGGAGTWTSFLPAQTQVGPHLMRGIDQVAGLARALPGWVERIELLSVDPAVTADPLPGLGMPDCLPQALTAAIDLAGDFRGYWAGRSRKLRQRIRAIERVVEAELPPARLVQLREPQDIAAAVSRYAALESRGWKGSHGTALVPGNEQEHFYIDLLTRFARDGKAGALELWYGETLAASRLTIESAKAIATLKTTYDESLRRYAPGRLMLRNLIERAFDEYGGKRIEFCTNATQEQLSWMTDWRQVCHWTVFRSPRAADLHRGLRAVLGCWRARQPLPGGDEIATVAVHAGHAQLPQAALQLLDEQAGANVELGADWFAHLERSVFAVEGGVRYLVQSHGSAIVAVLPLVHQRRAGGVRAAGLSSIYTSLYRPSLAPWLGPTDLLPLLRALRRELAPLASLTLAPIDLKAPAVRTLAAALAMDGFAVFPYFCFINWTLKSPRSWIEYLAARPGALRNTIVRSTKRLRGLGGRTEIVTGTPDAERALAAFQHVYARSWKVPEPFPAFIPGLVRLCAAKGWLRLGIAWLGEQPIGSQLWIVAHGRAAIFKLAYDEAHKKLGAGTALTAKMMAHVIEQDRVAEVDFLIGDDAYKRDWMDERRERWGLVAYNLRSPGGLAGWLRESAGRALRHWFEQLGAARHQRARGSP